MFHRPSDREPLTTFGYRAHLRRPTDMAHRGTKCSAVIWLPKVSGALLMPGGAVVRRLVAARTTKFWLARPGRIVSVTGGIQQWRIQQSTHRLQPGPIQH